VRLKLDRGPHFAHRCLKATEHEFIKAISGQQPRCGRIKIKPLWWRQSTSPKMWISKQLYHGRKCGSILVQSCPLICFICIFPITQIIYHVY